MLLVDNDKESITIKEVKKVLPDKYVNNLLDVTKYGNLRQLWKISDRNLSNSLAEEYDEVFFLYYIYKCFLISTFLDCKLYFTL